MMFVIEGLDGANTALLRAQQQIEEGEVGEIQAVESTEVVVQLQRQTGVGMAEVQAEGEGVGAHGLL